MVNRQIRVTDSNYVIVSGSPVIDHVIMARVTKAVKLKLS